MLCVGESGPEQNKASFQKGKGKKQRFSGKPPAEKTAGSKAHVRGWAKGLFSPTEGPFQPDRRAFPAQPKAAVRLVKQIRARLAAYPPRSLGPLPRECRAHRGGREAS